MKAIPIRCRRSTKQRRDIQYCKDTTKNSEKKVGRVIIAVIRRVGEEKRFSTGKLGLGNKPLHDIATSSMALAARRGAR